MRLKQLLGCLVISLFLLAFAVTPAQAQRRATPLTATSATELATDSASASATATDSAVATSEATLQQKIQEKTDKDITETTSKSKDQLVVFLDQHPISSLSWHNFLQTGIRRAVNNGLPINIVVLILLFPVITAIISFSRHVIGLKGFGVYTPAVLSVAFVSTGIINGLLTFMLILFAAMIMRKILKRLNLQYLPRTAMLLWGVSVFMLAFLIGISFVSISNLFTISIFPLLIIMLLTENFLESQLSGSQSEAQQLTIETLIIAIVCSVIIGAPIVQQAVLLQPELTLLGVALLNLVVGRYAGLRFLEWLRFRSIID